MLFINNYYLLLQLCVFGQLCLYIDIFIKLKQGIVKQQMQQEDIINHNQQNINQIGLTHILNCVRQHNWIILNEYLEQYFNSGNYNQLEGQLKQKIKKVSSSIQIQQHNSNDNNNKSNQIIKISVDKKKLIFKEILTQLQNQHKTHEKSQKLRDIDDQVEQTQIQKQVSTQINESMIVSRQDQQNQILTKQNASYRPLSVQEIQSIIKIVSKLLIQDLKYDTDLIIVQRALLLQKTNHIQKNNLKYLFMIYQESYIELKQQARKLQLTGARQLFLKIKFLYLNNEFVQIMHEKVFMDVMGLIHAFYQFQQQFIEQECCEFGQQNDIQQYQDKRQLLEFSLKYTKKLIKTSKQYFKSQAVKNYQWNQQKTKLVFQLIRFLFKCIHNQIFKKYYEQLFQGLLNLTCLVVDRLQLYPLCKFLPGFYLESQFDAYQSVYNDKQLLHIFGSCLIRQLPEKPQFAIIYQNYFKLINFVCGYIFIQNQIEDLSFGLESNKFFIVDLYERLTILKGVLNKKDTNAQLVQNIINSVLSKKGILSESAYEFLWRTLTQKHKDVNFTCYCISQYKKIIGLNTKPQNIIKISKFVLKLVKVLQPNQNIQKIGTIITLTFYYLISFKKICQKQKQNSVLNFVLSQLKISNKLQQWFDKLKSGLDDRIKILREKTGDNIEKDINELNICIYRIDELVF